MPLFPKDTISSTSSDSLTSWEVKVKSQTRAEEYVNKCKAEFKTAAEKETKQRKINLGMIYSTLLRDLDFDNLVDQLGELNIIVCNAAHLNGQLEIIKKKVRSQSITSFGQQLGFKSSAKQTDYFETKASGPESAVEPVCSVKQVLEILGKKTLTEAEQNLLNGFLLTSEMTVNPNIDFAGRLGKLFKQTLSDIEVCAKKGSYLTLRPVLDY